MTTFGIYFREVLSSGLFSSSSLLSCLKHWAAERHLYPLWLQLRRMTLNADFATSERLHYGELRANLDSCWSECSDTDTLVADLLHAMGNNLSSSALCRTT